MMVAAIHGHVEENENCNKSPELQVLALQTTDYSDMDCHYLLTTQYNSTVLISVFKKNWRLHS